jgi:hypothetical protein
MIVLSDVEQRHVIASALASGDIEEAELPLAHGFSSAPIKERDRLLRPIFVKELERRRRPRRSE